MSNYKRRRSFNVTGGFQSEGKSGVDDFCDDGGIECG